MGVLHVGQKIEEQANFEKIYKNGVDAFYPFPDLMILSTNQWRSPHNNN